MHSRRRQKLRKNPSSVEGDLVDEHLDGVDPEVADPSGEDPGVVDPRVGEHLEGEDE